MMGESTWRTHVMKAGGDARPLLDTEWLVTNGTGAFAMGTAMGCPTRRYHGLLVAATQPPAGRVVMLNQVWEQLVLRRAGEADALLRAPSITQPLEFTTLAFHGDRGQLTFAPRGQEMLTRFERGLSVKWTYQWGDITFERELFLHWKQQAITLRYRINGLAKAGSRATLRLQPMLTMRDFHATLHRGLGGGPFRFEARGEKLIVRHDELAMAFACDGGRFEPNEHWWYRVHYPLDAERGQEDHEDYFIPGVMEVELASEPAVEACFTAALGEQAARPIAGVDARAKHLEPMRQRIAGFTPDAAPAALETVPSGTTPKRRSASPEAGAEVAPSEASENRLATALTIAADDFVVDRRVGEAKLSTIIAGYPWFGDWGRDTFIALPGLLIETGRLDEAQAVLRAFAGSIRDGLVPNRFDDYDADAAHYNTVDASLWFIRAALQYLDASGDRDAWHDWLATACFEIVHHYRHGTGGDDGKLIAMDDDGLIAAGHHGTQLTWMDAACGGTVFTPRPGKCVEINALWHHALLALADEVDRDPISPATADDEAPPEIELRKLADRVKRSFNKLFWNANANCLFDHVWRDDTGKLLFDQAVRPNQAFAAAVPNGPLTQARQRQVVAAVRTHLLTPVGLRTLPASDPAYHGRYTGDQYQRDEAYHQGTVWPWLIGPYAEAVLRAGKFSAKARAEARGAIAPLLDRLLATQTPLPGGLGQLHEIYEADADEHGKHRPVGCPAQAWSVAEVLRVLRLTQTA